MKKCFVLLQFGTPHSWTQKYIDHVQFLEKYGWYWKIFTPNNFKSKGNVEVIPMNVGQFNSLCEQKLGINAGMFITDIGLPSFHVTDFNVVLGAIFEDYLKDYDFWGCIGWDTLMGRLDHFVPDSELVDCDIWTDDVNIINGTFCLFYNVKKINDLYKQIPQIGMKLAQPPCARCLGKIDAPHSLMGTDEYDFTELVKTLPIRYKYPKYYPVHGHDRLANHEIEIKDDGSLWELNKDTPPDWPHAHKYFGREIAYYHFMLGKAWPIETTMDYFTYYQDKLRKRYSTMLTALHLLKQLPNHNIVETGTIRHKDDYGGGNSTYIFGEFVNKFGGHLTTIDINPEAIEASKQATNELSNITYIVENSLTAIPKTGEIDLLYLDSFDAPETGDATECQEHNLKEFQQAESHLHAKSIVLIDDNDMDNGGKSRLTKNYLRRQGWREVIDSAQTLWIK